MVSSSFQNREILVLELSVWVVYTMFVTFEVFEGESGNIVSYAIESCFDKD